MIDTERFVLPFKWREFGKWFSTLGAITEKSNSQLEVKDVYFEAGDKRLDGIRVVTTLNLSEENSKDLFMITFLADMETLDLFEPFFGNPDKTKEFGLSGRFVRASPGKSCDVELFIPDQGWILPSIWRFLVESVGLRKRDDARMPEIIVFGFEAGSKSQTPLFFARKPFDYFGNARRLKEQMALSDFFRLLNVSAFAPEEEVQRAYIVRCREFEHEQENRFPREVYRRRVSILTRIKNGYQIWSERVGLKVQA